MIATKSSDLTEITVHWLALSSYTLETNISFFVSLFKVHSVCSKLQQTLENTVVCMGTHTLLEYSRTCIFP